MLKAGLYAQDFKCLRCVNQGIIMNCEGLLLQPLHIGQTKRNAFMFNDLEDPTIQ